MEKNKKQIRKKLIASIVIVSFVICAASCLVGYIQYDQTMRRLYNENGYVIGEIILGEIDHDRIANYAQTWQEDEYYPEMATYLDSGELDVKLLGRGFAWLDTGTMDSLIEAGDFVRMVESRQGIKISAVEEIAYVNGWIDKAKLLESAAKYGKSPYGQHLRKVAEGKIRHT